MTFDLQTWCEQNLETSRPSGPELPAICPFCGRSGKFSINVEKKLFRCFHSSCQQGHVARVIAHVDGCSLTDAFERLSSNIELEAPKHQRMKRYNPLSKAFNIELPDEFIPCYDHSRAKVWRVPSYLNDRLNRDTIRTFGLGFCTAGRYRDRIVIPIKCPNGHAFTARAADSERVPKYLNPDVKFASSMLFGWDIREQMSNPNADLVLCEGPFDAMKLVQCGYSALAMLGKKISDAQVHLLASLIPRSVRILIMLDPKETQFTLDKIAERLYILFRVYRSGILHAEDPGSATKEQIDFAIDNSELWS